MSTGTSNDKWADLPDLERKVLEKVGKAFAGDCGPIMDAVTAELKDADTVAAVRALVEKGLVALPHGSDEAVERDTPIRLTSKGADCLEIRLAVGREIVGVIGMLLAVRRLVVGIAEELATDGNRDGERFRGELIAGLRDDISRERQSARSAGTLSDAKCEWLGNLITDIESLKGQV